MTRPTNLTTSPGGTNMVVTVDAQIAAWEQGRAFCYLGGAATDCPFPPGSILANCWMRGFGDELRGKTTHDDIPESDRTIVHRPLADIYGDETESMVTAPEPEAVPAPEPERPQINWFWIAYIVVLSAVLLCAVMYGCSEGK